MDVEPAGLLLVGQQCRDAGVGGKHRRLEAVEPLDELRHRHVRRKRLEAAPPTLLQASRGDGGRKMAARGHDDRRAPAAGDDPEDVAQTEPVADPAEHHRGHDRHRPIVGQEYPPAAGGA